MIRIPILFLYPLLIASHEAINPDDIIIVEKEVKKTVIVPPLKLPVATPRNSPESKARTLKKYVNYDDEKESK